MHITAEELLASLRQQGHRITSSRRAICTVIAASHDDHLDASQILEKVREMGESTDQSTVYRTLEALESAGMLTHSHLGHRAAVYHLAADRPHQHLICERCGRTVTLDAADLESWTDAIESRSGFVVDPNHFALTGLCAKCFARSSPDLTTPA
jgi:Fur family ferric uptake transcriptional regulator